MQQKWNVRLSASAIRFCGVVEQSPRTVLKYLIDVVYDAENYGNGSFQQWGLQMTLESGFQHSRERVLATVRDAGIGITLSPVNGQAR